VNRERMNCMKKIYRMEDLDCANCAAKMENSIRNLNGVKKASVSFLMQKLTIEVEDEGQLEEIMKQAVSICRKIEPNCTILF